MPLSPKILAMMGGAQEEERPQGVLPRITQNASQRYGAENPGGTPIERAQFRQADRQMDRGINRSNRLGRRAELAEMLGLGGIEQRLKKRAGAAAMRGMPTNVEGV